MKKILLLALFSFCLPFMLGSSISAEIPNYVRVVYPQISVYSQTDINAEDTQIIAIYKYNQILKTIGEEAVFGADGYEYYQVEISVSGYTSGYVFKSQVVDQNSVSPAKKLKTNAQIATKCNIYLLNGNNYEQTSDVLEKGTAVKIISGYDKSKEFTQIQYENQNGDVVTAYVKTVNLKTSGVSRTLIGTIIIVVTTVSLVLLIFGIKGKKRG